MKRFLDKSITTLGINPQQLNFFIWKFLDSKLKNSTMKEGLISNTLRGFDPNSFLNVLHIVGEVSN